MKILLLGGNGFIGAALIKWLSQLDKVSLYCVTRNNINIVKSSDKIQWVSVDALKTFDELKSNLSECDVVINAIGELRDEDRMDLVNFQLVKWMVDELAQSQTPKRLIQISSVGCYGAISRFQNKVVTIKYDDSEHPVGNYEVTKKHADNYIREVLGKPGTRSSYTILRPTNVFGSKMKSSAVLSLVHAVKNEYFFYIADKKAISTYVHVEDVAQAVFLAIKNLEASSNQVFIVSDDCPQVTLINAFANALSLKSPKLVIPLWLIRPLAWLCEIIFSNSPLTKSSIASLTAKVSFSNEKTQQLLGYKPVHSICSEVEVGALLKSWNLK